MDINVLELANKLKKGLSEDPRVLVLNEREKRMANDNEVIFLAYKKDMANDRYNDMLRLFGDESNEAKEARIALFKAKEELDQNNIVREYIKAYQDVRILYNEINDILFSPFWPNACPKEKK